MTTLTLDRKDLEEHIGKIDSEKEEKITSMGTQVESVSEREVSVEITPNRPDLLSMQGFTRSFLQYTGKKGIESFKVNESDYSVRVDKSVKSVRPFTVCAVIKGLKFDDKKIKEIVDIQEKLHLTLGRKRKKIAIGIYPLEKIEFPIKFIAKKPSEILFRPLEFPKELTGAQILRQHPTGRDYAHLLDKAEVFPIFVDAKDRVLSMPPIINSHETGKISENTKDVFVECSGFNLYYLNKTMNILSSVFSDMGGKIYSVKIIDSKPFVSPNLEPEKIEFKVENINKTLGLNLTEKEIKNYLERMGIGFEKPKDKCYALIPCYRVDVLHWIDLAEEVAVAYGFENFNAEIPEISTIGEEDKMSVFKRAVSEILAGLGLLEVSSYHLTTKDDVRKMHYEYNDFIEAEESKTEYNVLRMDLISNLLKVLSENSDSSYPQKIFENGRVFELDEKEETGIKEKERLGIAICDEKANFTELKQVLDYLFKMLDKEYKIEECENNNFISGRVGKIIVNEREIGVIGEIAPRVLKNWKIGYPVPALELNLSSLM